MMMIKLPDSSMIFILLLLMIIIDQLSLMINCQSIHGHTHPHRSVNQHICPECLDERLIEHYRVRKCRPIYLGRCKCPSRYDCSDYFDDNDDGKLKRHSEFGADHDHDHEHENLNDLDIRGRSFEMEFDYYNHCHYNGTRYRIGDIVPTKNACRICVCSFMADGSVNVDCPSKIECPKPPEHRGKKLNQFNGYFTPLNMMIGPKSIQRYRRRPMLQQSNNNNEPESLSMSLYCYDYYQHDQCCPRQECIPMNMRTGRTLMQRKTCQYSGKQYQIGEKIQLADILKPNGDGGIDGHSDHSDDPDDSNEENTIIQNRLTETIACMQCLCTENWNNSLMATDSLDFRRQLPSILSSDPISCRRKSCILDLDPRFRRGCIPVYDTDKCCPIDFVCPRTRQMTIRVRGVDFGSKMCHFEGRKYPVGSRIYQSRHEAANCVDCECRVPPEFTCIKRKNCQQQQQSLTI